MRLWPPWPLACGTSALRGLGAWGQLGLSAVSPRERSAWLLRARGKRPFRSQHSGRPPFPGLAVSARGRGPCAARPPLLRPEEGSGGSRAPRGRALARGHLPFTGLGATRSHRCPSCPRTGRVWGPNCSRNVAFQRNPVDSGLLPSAASLRFRVLRPPGVAGGREVAGPRSPSRWLQAPRGGNVSGRECGARWRSKGGAPALGLARSPETTAHCHLCLGLAGDGLSAVRIALSLVDTQRPAALTDREVACRPSPRHATPSCLSLL